MTEAGAAANLLEVRDLRVRFATASGPVEAVRGVSFAIKAGERLGLAGESGSGKSVMSLAILGLLGRAKVTGSIKLDGVELVGASPGMLRTIRARRIGYVFQDPLASLDPVRTVGSQVAEVLQLQGVRCRKALERAADMLGEVGIPHPRERMGEYPHQFSGGMRQRVMIAIALIGEPDLVIADEPTTALDVRVQAQVIDLLHRLGDERGLAVTLITHDLAILAGFAERVLIMNRGVLVEEADVDDIYYHPQNGYTRSLLASMPRIDGPIPERLAQVGEPL